VCPTTLYVREKILGDLHIHWKIWWTANFEKLKTVELQRREQGKFLVDVNWYRPFNDL